MAMATHDWHHSAHLPSRRDVAVETGLDSRAALLLGGRLLFGGYFLYSGLQHFVNHASMASYAALAGVPAPELAVAFSGVLLVLGGLSFLGGYWPKVGAGCLALFLLTVTPIMHAYWNDAPGPAQMANFANFTKNLALLGGVCFAAAVPEPWPFSLGSRTTSRAALARETNTLDPPL
jgi:uncharacterized membrane protein YphA (DoxX/SURF4 family)